MNGRTAAGIVLIPLGLLVMWGGVSGYLAAILAALFARDQLVPVSGTGLFVPPFVKPPGYEPKERPSQPQLEPGAKLPQLEGPDTAGAAPAPPPPAELPPGDIPPVELPVPVE